MAEAITKASIDQVAGKINPQMVLAEDALKTLLGGITSGGDVTTAQLLQIQSAMAKYTLTASIFSAIIKELSDSLKQTASKIGGRSVMPDCRVSPAIRGEYGRLVLTRPRGLLSRQWLALLFSPASCV